MPNLFRMWLHSGNASLKEKGKGMKTVARKNERFNLLGASRVSLYERPINLLTIVYNRSRVRND